MSIAAENTNTDSRVIAVIAQQRRLLKRWENISHYLGGVGAGIYMPGIDQTFDRPIRRIAGRRRPPLLTLEGDSLNFTGAISRRQNNKLVYTPIFNYDLTLPYTPRGGGRTLPANNLVLARRANELLSALVGFGQRVSFNMHEPLPPFRFPEVIRNSRGFMISENYANVLGLEVDNPAKSLETISVRVPCPAAKILARHGIEFPMSVGTEELENLVREFRAEFPLTDISWSVAVDALLFNRDYFSVDMPIATAAEVAPNATVLAMQHALPSAKLRWEASHAELLRAAQNPNQPLTIGRLSAVQVFPIETVQDMPDDYAGTVLAPVDWAPPDSNGLFADDDHEPDPTRPPAKAFAA